MIRVILHVAFLLLALWYQRKSDYRHHPLVLSLVWYAAGVPLVLIESKLAAQNLLIALFYLPPAYLAFQHARRRRKSLWGPLLLYVMLAGAATLLAALVLARAETVRGLTWPKNPPTL